jgi:hypothetical protein
MKDQFQGSTILSDPVSPFTIGGIIGTFASSLVTHHSGVIWRQKGRRDVVYMALDTEIEHYRWINDDSDPRSWYVASFSADKGCRNCMPVYMDENHGCHEDISHNILIVSVYHKGKDICVIGVLMNTTLWK